MSINVDDSLLFTPILNKFIEDYMPSANPSYVVVYIYLYKQAYYGSSIDTSQIALKLSLLESDVINALKYWESKKLISLDMSNTMSMQFLPIPLAQDTQQQSVQPPPKQSTQQINPKQNTVAPTKNIVPLLLETKPNYSVQEIDMYLNRSQDVKELMAFTQKCMAKHLNYNDMKTVYGFYDWLGLPFDLIRYLLEYCCLDLNKRSWAYIETVAKDWHDKNITDVEQAKKYTESHNRYYKILQAFGIRDKDPVPYQINFMKKWLDDLNTSMDLIAYAAEKSISATGKASFEYADTVITNWHTDKITTLEQAKQADEKFKAAKATKSNKPNTQTGIMAKPTRFVNFQEQEWDFDELKRLEEEYIEERLREER